MKQKIRIGVLGGGRGFSLAQFCEQSDIAELVAVCDNDPRCLNGLREHFGENVAYYDDFDAFLGHEMDLVVLANYANAHAPFAVKALKAGKNVLSELLPFQTMKEACQLADAVDASGKRYFYGENCCFMAAPKKMRQLFQSGQMGQFRYGEGEYMHDLEKDWHRHSHSNPNHWRNTMTAFFYCTHSIGPLIHISGLRPVSVTGFEAPYTEKMRRMGAKGAPFGMEIITLENGALLKS
ncbi:MAG: Gfo/Idh/MocA family oxidoreductase, partial [Clostridia bacterium]|nr:Gfo/Idh/MocA family oxidoreductase [Clostridia bacterium]